MFHATSIFFFEFDWLIDWLIDLLATYYCSTVLEAIGHSSRVIDYALFGPIDDY